MANSAQLVRLISEVTGVGLPTLTDIDRRLMRAGLRSKVGRGRSAGHMAPSDAARLLTAVLTAPQSVAAVNALTRYEATAADKGRSSDGFFAGIGIGDLAALPANHSFIDGLAALIGSAASGDLAALRVKAGRRSLPRIEVYAFTRSTYGRIRLSALPGGKSAAVEYTASASGLQAPADVEGDLEQSRRISERTIYAVAALLAEDR